MALTQQSKDRLTSWYQSNGEPDLDRGFNTDAGGEPGGMLTAKPPAPQSGVQNFRAPASGSGATIGRPGVQVPVILSGTQAPGSGSTNFNFHEDGPGPGMLYTPPPTPTPAAGGEGWDDVWRRMGVTNPTPAPPAATTTPTPTPAPSTGDPGAGFYAGRGDPSKWNPDIYTNSDERRRAWEAAGRPDRDSQGRIMTSDGSPQTWNGVTIAPAGTGFNATLSGGLHPNANPNGTLGGGAGSGSGTGAGTGAGKGTGTGSAASGSGAYTLNPADLERRRLDTTTETVEGRINEMMKNGNPYVEGARTRANADSNARGLLNSSIAATAGEDAALRAAFDIANPDAAAMRGAGDYNTALSNQARMYNADQQNALLLKTLGIESEERMQGRSILAQMDIAKLQDATTRLNQERQNANSRYNTDRQYQQEIDRTNLTLINNIMHSTEIPPARRAELLRAMGRPDLADAIYLITDAGADLDPNRGIDPATGRPRT